MAALDGRYRADQIAVGVPDERLAPQIERQLAQSGVAARSAIGKQLPETGPYRLLKVAADYAARRRFRDLAALVRHPDVFDWLLAHLRGTGQLTGDLLTTLDDFASEHLPARLDDERLAKDPKAAGVVAIASAAEQLVQPLSGQSQPLGQWADRLRGVLLAVYGNRELDRNRPADRYLLEALESTVRRARFTWPACRRSWRRRSMPGRRAASCSMAWRAKALRRRPTRMRSSCSAGSSCRSTMRRRWSSPVSTKALSRNRRAARRFLPNRLRQSLGILHNDRRLARDAYALSVLLASRQELQLIVARRDADGNPLAPSRLLFATDGDRVVSRAQRFFGDLPQRRRGETCSCRAAGR